MSRNDSIAYSIFVDEDNQQLISAFRGTNTKWQLAVEAYEGTDVEYDLYDVSDAMVTDYFYNRYTDYLRDDYLSNFESYVSQYSGYTYVFTGHSLGAALTTHAALDTVLGGTISGGDAIMYNFGSPRVGNYAFANEVVGQLSEIARVVHWKDLVPHVPLCKTEDGNCATFEGQSVYTESGDRFWPAWHVWPQIFYNEDFSSYQSCSAEDPSCQNQFSVTECSISDHLDYLGVKVGCTPATPNKKNSKSSSSGNSKSPSSAGAHSGSPSNSGDGNSASGGDSSDSDMSSSDNSTMSSNSTLDSYFNSSASSNDPSGW
eukprot:CAMPEP_0114582698 /NCGR_PEP_ID=MMETSP0125-20121206/6613_1 /TAXON_ID=485358 ORGANISM="Aristerostoma sp., Strain ATCC 50986" /NCGR_SAMPLE_ID=MMETSP0125 /ASSEMBLY_ACC=CAM_ASM_000245 /LENGTH=315 /DNA_ID=CAMNT_0001775779 /DNA_START=130 /DNA_END=1074 /DNA_ORIENTATION=+